MYKISKNLLPGIIVLTPSRHEDERGYFSEIWNKRDFKDMGLDVDFVQENHSLSIHSGTVRGLHFQAPPFAQAKLVRCGKGKILDVAVDIRKSSPTFGQHVAVELTGDNKHQLFVPHGFAHGFIVLSNSATFAYKVDNYFAPEHDRGIAFDDKELKIDWQLSEEELQLSEKDMAHPPLANAKNLFE